MRFPGEAKEYLVISPLPGYPPGRDFFRTESPPGKESPGEAMAPLCRGSSHVSAVTEGCTVGRRRRVPTLLRIAFPQGKAPSEGLGPCKQGKANFASPSDFREVEDYTPSVATDVAAAPPAQGSLTPHRLCIPPLQGPAGGNSLIVNHSKNNS